MSDTNVLARRESRDICQPNDKKLGSPSYSRDGNLESENNMDDNSSSAVHREQQQQQLHEELLHRKLWRHALSPVRAAHQQLSRRSSDGGPLKVAVHGVAHVVRATSDGVCSVAKKSVSFAQHAAAGAMEITPLRKKLRIRKEVATESDGHDDDSVDDDDEEVEEVKEVDDATTTSTGSSCRYEASVSSSFLTLDLIIATKMQLQLLALVTLALAILFTILYYVWVADHNQVPTPLVIVWMIAAFCGGRAFEAMIVERRSRTVAERDLDQVKRPVRRVSKEKRHSKKQSQNVKIPWTILANQGLKQVECNEDIQATLMNRLLQNPLYQHKKVLSDTATESSQHPLITQAVDPICKLRGVDVFLAETADDDLASHPFLIKNGLRDVPTFMVNLIAQWGNLALYYELPSWFESWESLREQENDQVEVKALKRFLSGDDEFRTKRIRMLPSVVEGPLPIRVLAPPKKEMSVEGKWYASAWKKREVEFNAEGRRLAPLLEMEVDLVSSRTLRGMANLVKRYLPTLSVDVAMVLQKPEGQVEDEPEACLCVWRFHHMDITGCPQLPDRSIKVDRNDQRHPDVLRASRFVRISDEELLQLSAENEA